MIKVTRLSKNRELFPNMKGQSSATILIVGFKFCSALINRY